jgi:plastocyanin
MAANIVRFGAAIAAVASVVATIGGGAPANAAFPDAISVSAFDTGGFDLFAPSTIEIRRGGTVTFTFDGPSSHTATDGSGLELYDSGVVADGGPDEVFTYVAAGTYDVVCTLHAEMGATVYVPVGVSPRTTARGDGVSVRWASASPGAGLAYDVQIRRPGRSWMSYRDDDVTGTAAFVPNKRGTYRFRAAMVSTATSARSAWSRVATLEVR